MSITTVSVGLVIEAGLAVTVACLAESAGHHARLDTLPRHLITWIMAGLCAATGVFTPIISGMVNDGGIRLCVSIVLMVIALAALAIPGRAYKHGRELRAHRQCIP